MKDCQFGVSPVNYSVSDSNSDLSVLMQITESYEEFRAELTETEMTRAQVGTAFYPK